MPMQVQALRTCISFFSPSAAAAWSRRHAWSFIMDFETIRTLIRPAETKIVLLVLDGLGGLPREH